MNKAYVGTDCNRNQGLAREFSLSQALRGLDFEAQNYAHLYLATCLSHLPIPGNVGLVLSWYGKCIRASAEVEFGQHRFGM